VTVEEKYKLQLLGSFCVNEEVKTAAFGSLRHTRKHGDNESTDQTSLKRKPKTARNADVEMIEGEGEMEINDKFDILIRTELEFTRKVVASALSQVE
jgi:hypothetical protein